MRSPIPNTHRFFVPPEAISGDAVLLDDPALAHQISGVLRLRVGERVLLLDDSGSEYTVVLSEVGRKRLTGQVESSAPGTGEPHTQLTLYVALLRGERFEWVLQKGTELGVAAFVPVQCTRSLGSDRADEHKLERWRRIVREAAEQSCRARLPRLAPPLPFEQACVQAASISLALLLYEGEGRSLREVVDNFDIFSKNASDDITLPKALAVISGPEGGVVPEELTSATRHGIIPVSLGPRILRAETAPIAAAAAIMYALGEL